MFFNVIKFNQNINNWNIFILFYKLKTTFFLYLPYKNMEPLKKIFDLFNLNRKKNYIKFLTNYSYIMVKN